MLLGDAQNTVRFSRTRSKTANAAVTTNTYNYSPFGELLAPPTTATVSGATGADGPGQDGPGQRGYLNKPLDPAGGLRLDHRTYQPGLNVLTTPDPILNPADPQSLNPYAYSGNDPINQTDPSGLMTQGGAEHTGVAQVDRVESGIASRETGPGTVESTVCLPGGYCAMGYAASYDNGQTWQEITGNPLSEAFDEVLKIAVDVAVGDFIGCIQNPNLLDCASAALSLIPVGKVATTLLRGTRTVVKSIEAVRRTEKVVEDVTDAVRAVDNIADTTRTAGRVAKGDRNTLFHYTDEAGQEGILKSGKLNPSLKSVSPKDARYGDGQYLSDIVPGTRTCAQLSARFLNIPFQGKKCAQFIEIDVSGLNVIEGRDGVFVNLSSEPLDISQRIVRYGSN